MVGLRPTILSLGRASELALPSLNRMVRHVPHILVGDLFVPVDAAVLSDVCGAGAAATVAKGAFGASDAGADDVLVLDTHNAHSGLLILYLHIAILRLFDDYFTSVVYVDATHGGFARELAAVERVPCVSLIMNYEL